MTDTTLTPEEIQDNLKGFHGTEQYYKASFFSKIVCTDGVQYLREKCNCYWYTDLIVSHQTNKKVRQQEFQTWKLKTDLKKNKAIAICEDGNGNVIVTQKIPYTDFSLEEITVYLTNNVILLPSEY